MSAKLQATATTTSDASGRSVVMPGQDIAKQLMFAFVLSRLDYCNGVLAGLPKSTLSTLQHVQNAAARLVLNLRPRDHITEALKQLHWLPIEQRIQFKLCLLMHSSNIRILV